MWVSAACLALALDVRTAHGQNTPTRAAATQRFRLENGLDVVLEPQPQRAQVAVLVRYHVGRRDQPAGYTGLAHLVEHLMFERSAHGSSHFIESLEAMGATDVNGVTSSDYTTYYEVVPPHQLQRTLWLESDRMGHLLARINERSLDAQRRVVLNEDRERTAGPRMTFLRAIHERLYPTGHPYREIGEFHEDLEAISVANIQWFYQRWYTPANATLVVVGSFDPRVIRTAIERDFGSLRGGPAPARAAPAAINVAGDLRVTVDAPVFNEQLFFLWPSPPIHAQGDAALDLVASVLATPSIGRLHRRLVHDLDFAEDVRVTQQSQELCSQFSVQVIATEEHTADELLPIVQEELQALRADPVSSDELVAAKRAFVDHIRSSSSSVLSRAEQLARYSRWSATEIDLTERDAARYESVTALDLQNAARNILRTDARVVARLRRARRAPAEGQVASLTSSSSRAAQSVQGTRR